MITWVQGSNCLKLVDLHSSVPFVTRGLACHAKIHAATSSSAAASALPGYSQGSERKRQRKGSSSHAAAQSVFSVDEHELVEEEEGDFEEEEEEVVFEEEEEGEGEFEEEEGDEEEGDEEEEGDDDESEVLANRYVQDAEDMLLAAAGEVNAELEELGLGGNMDVERIRAMLRAATRSVAAVAVAPASPTVPPPPPPRRSAVPSDDDAIMSASSPSFWPPSPSAAPDSVSVNATAERKQHDEERADRVACEHRRGVQVFLSLSPLSLSHSLCLSYLSLTLSHISLTHSLSSLSLSLSHSGEILWPRHALFLFRRVPLHPLPKERGGCVVPGTELHHSGEGTVHLPCL